MVQSAAFLGSWGFGVAALSADPELSSPQGQAVLGSPSHRPPSASGSPCCLGKLTAAQRPPSASGLGQSTARPPPPFVRELVTQIFPSSSQHQPHACGAFSRVARKAGPTTSGTPLRPPPGEDFVEEDSGSVPPTRRGQPPAPLSRRPAGTPGTLQPSSHSGPAKRSWAGPGWARLIENPGRWGCLSPPGSRRHTHTHNLDRRTFQEVVRPESRGLKCPRLRRESQTLVHPSPAPAPSPWSFRPTCFAFLGLASSDRATMPRQQGPTWVGRA